MLLLGEGHEMPKDNLNYFFEEYGMSINKDSVLRSVFYKYLHPKETFIAEGILVPDLARKKVSILLLKFMLLII